MYKYFQGLYVALSFLTVIPLCRFFSMDWNIEAQRLSVCFYGFVGILLAGVLGVVYYLIPAHVSDIMVATLLIATLACLTGGLHLDGLADCVDGLSAAHAAPERIFEVMKDPRCGSMSVVSLILILLLKISSLACLLAMANSFFVFSVFLLSLVLARISVQLLMIFTLYVSKNGIAENFSHGLSKCRVLISVSGMMFFLYWCVPGLLLLLSTATALCVWFLWRYIWLHKIGGYTGDVAGALIELQETAALFVACLFIPLLDLSL